LSLKHTQGMLDFPPSHSFFVDYLVSLLLNNNQHAKCWVVDSVILGSYRVSLCLITSEKSNN